jgi:hypothetical protein
MDSIHPIRQILLITALNGQENTDLSVSLGTSVHSMNGSTDIIAMNWKTTAMSTMSMAKPASTSQIQDIIMNALNMSLMGAGANSTHMTAIYMQKVALHASQKLIPGNIALISQLLMAWMCAQDGNSAHTTLELTQISAVNLTTTATNMLLME